MHATLFRQSLAEFIGTAFLLATVIGSGIMAERFAGGNVALALLCNTVPTGAILFVLITTLAPISGGHFNPAVTGVFLLRRELKPNAAAAFIAAQCAGALIGMLVAHLMFEEPLFQLSTQMRSGIPQWCSEWVATFGLVLSILLTLRAKPNAISAVVGLYITSAYWFTASTSFANPAVTLARSLSDTFSGIRPLDAPAFVIAQLAGAASALYVCEILIGSAEKPNRPKSLAQGGRT